MGKKVNRKLTSQLKDLKKKGMQQEKITTIFLTFPLLLIKTTTFLKV